MVFAAALIVRVGCSSSLSPDRLLSFGVSPFGVKSVVRDVSFSLGKERFKPGRRFDRIVGPLWKNVGNIDQDFRLRNNVARCEMGSNLEDTSLNKKTVNSLSGGHFVDNLSAKDCCAARNVSPLNENGDSYAANPGGSSGDGEFPPRDGFGGNGGDGNDGSGKDDNPDEKVASLLKYEEVMKRAGSRGVKLPSDMCEAAKTVGIEKELFENYLNLQELAWPLGAAIRWFPLLRDRMLMDRQFLFKIGAEIVIDSCCATVAEVQKRGKDFWAEFELYAADLLVGVVVNVALVGLLAPYARIGQPPVSKGFLSSMARYYDSLPSSVFEAARPGCCFSVQQRAGSYFIKGILYASVGFACGLVGQGIANLIMTAKRSVKTSEDDVPVPPLIKSAALWGLFLAVSSNTRYQIVNGLERVVESTTAAKSAPLLAMGFTVGIRLSNNIYGGMQFVDWARWSGCQ